MQISGVTIQGGMNILPRTGAPSPTPGPSDPNFSDVVFMFDGDGTNGGANNTFTDSSTNGFTVTETGDVVQGSFSPYGNNWSVYFNSNEYLTIADNANLDVSGAMTAECWVYITDMPDENIGAVGQGYLINRWTASGDQRSWAFLYGNNGNIAFYSSSDGNANYTISTATGVLSTHKWIHVAASWDGTNQRLFIDGDLKVTTANASGPYSTPNSGFTVNAINTSLTGTNNSQYIADARYFADAAIYTSSFTPPTSPLTATSGSDTATVLLNSSNGFKDESPNNHTVTVNGTPQVTPFSPFKNDDARDITTDGGSAYFEGGATNVLSVPSDTNLDLSTGDFTVEMWVYLNSKINDSKLYIDITSASNYWQFKYASAYGWSLQYAGGTWIVNNGSASNVKTGEWQHVALTRSGSNFTIWQNGESYATGTSSANIGAYNAKNIGGWTGTSAGSIDGYISDFRLTKGTALYTSSFTPPTSPISAGANTELFLKFQDAGIYDLSGINNLDTVGNAQIDTSVKKYGTGSIEFDGSGDYLKTSGNEALKLGSGDWTLEFWVYFNAVNDGQVRFLFDWRTSTDTSNSFLAQESSNAWTYWNGAGSGITSGLTSSTFNTSTWHHVAISRDGSTTRFFVDGTNVGSPSDSSNYNSGTLVIGSRYNGQAYLDGYIDDLRITKGVARYTSNFTAPAAALPKF